MEPLVQGRPAVLVRGTQAQYRYVGVLRPVDRRRVAVERLGFEAFGVHPRTFGEREDRRCRLDGPGVLQQDQ
ncbi:hypothetical protein ACIQM4_04795 [Streptomyces sp. NPDC091272]|uniref:hypothetical protein n=1 Tax=Streptomyces sp. NPDC091272 TaxID=3365981 RepID=UPI0038263DAD